MFVMAVVFLPIRLVLWDGNGAVTGSLLHPMALSEAGGSPASGFEDLAPLTWPAFKSWAGL